MRQAQQETANTRSPIAARREHLASAEVIDWLVCFTSLLSLLLITQLGAVGALFFLLPWSLIVAKDPLRAFEAMARNAWLLVLPIFALTSVLWSDYPSATLRSAIQFLLTIIIGVLAGSCIRPRIFLSALFSALTCITVISVFSELDALLQDAGRVNLRGVFESKNQMATCAVLLSLTALAIVFDRMQFIILRFTAGTCFFLAIFAVYAANSAGSTVCIAPAVLAVGFTAILSKLATQTRAAILIGCVFIVLPTVVAAAMSLADPTAILDALGKDSTLTGRTELWANARALWDERPVLGYGYQAFWQVGNPKAEELWFVNNVDSGAGFHFHNLYLNTAVDLGMLGVFIVIALTLITAIRLCLAILDRPSAPQFFAAGLVVYLMLISFMEVLQTYQFHIATVLFYCSWCYLTPGTTLSRQDAPLRAVPEKCDAVFG